MSIKIGINGLGRIGRMIIRSLIENNNKEIEIKHVNSRSNTEVVSSLLKYDSIHGKFNCEIKHKDNHLIINGKKITFSQYSNLNEIKWKNFGVDYVLECTGKFNSKEKLIPHIKNGAKKVIVSAPCKGAINIIFGVNQKTLKNSDQVISATSCTTNCLAPVAKVINDNFGIETGFMITIHSYTADQRLLDNSHKDLRRARSAPNSIIPTTTGATKSLGDVIPELKGKVEGISIRVPTPNVSLVEFVFSSKKNLSVEKINNSLSKASKSELKNILDTTHEQLISTDFNHNAHSAIIDLSLTKVIEAKMAKVSAWYDNEWGFACRMCDLANYLGKI